MALRHQSDSLDVARAAARFVGQGVVGFDLAGREHGYPASLHRSAVELARAGGLGITLHAGEGHGLPSIVDALGAGTAMRLGHGVRILDDITVRDGSIMAMGRVARRVRDHQVPLELCITSNVHTAAVPSIEAHPLALLHRAGFNVTINTDNRLMSDVTMSKEVALARDLLGLDEDEVQAITANALRAGFGDYEGRRVLLDRLATARVHPVSTRSNE